MISKNEAKYIQSLFQKKQRDILGVFVAEGVKLAHELIQSGIDIEQIYATEDWEPEIPAPIPIQRVSAIELSKIKEYLRKVFLSRWIEFKTPVI